MGKGENLLICEPNDGRKVGRFDVVYRNCLFFSVGGENHEIRPNLSEKWSFVWFLILEFLLVRTWERNGPIICVSTTTFISKSILLYRIESNYDTSLICFLFFWDWECDLSLVLTSYNLKSFLIFSFFSQNYAGTRTHRLGIL